MAEYVMKITEEDRLEKITARTNAIFGEIMAKLEILLQQHNCSPSSSHGAANSSEEIPTLEPPLNVNLPIQDEICSSAKQIEVAAKPIPESSSSELYFDNLVTDSTKIVNDLGESALDNVQRIGEFGQEDGFEVQRDSQLTVNTTTDCDSGVISTPELSNAEPITTHSFHNKDTSQFGESQRKVTDDDVAGNRGLSLQCEIPFALYLTSIVDNRASSMEPKFQLHWDDLFTKHKLVVVSIYGNLAIDITGIQYDSRLIPPDKFLERLLDRAHPYVHMIFVVGVTQGLHGWNSQIKSYAQSGLLSFAHHMFAEMCEQGVLSWTDLIQGSVARVNGWNGKQFQSDLTSLLSFTGWYETPLPKPPDWTYDAIAKPPLPPEPPEMSSKVVVSTLPMIAKVLKFGAYNIKFGENSVWIADMLAILHVIEESNIQHNSLIDGSCLMESIESLLEKHEIIGGLVLDLVLLIGYNFQCVIGGKYFVLAATHGSVIQGHRLFVKLPNIDVVIWSNWIKSCDSFCAANLTSCLVLVMVLVGLVIKVQCYSPKANVNIYTKGVLQTGCIIIDVSRVHKLGAKKFGAFSITQQTSDPKMSCFLHLDYNFACTDTSQSPTKFSIYVKTHASQLLPQGKVHVFQFKLIVPAVSDTISAQKVILVACIWYILLDRVTLLLGMNTLEIIKSLLIGGCKPIICPQQVFLCACLLPCVLLLVSLSTTQQMSGSKKVIPEAFTHLALIVGDITRLEYLVSHTYLVTCLSSMRLDDGSCWTLHEKLILTSGNEHSFYPLKNVDDDRRLLYIGSGAETLALKNLEEFKKKIFWVQVALVELEFVLIYKSFINISFLQISAEQVVASKKVRMPIWNRFHIMATQDLQIDKSGVYYFSHIARSLHFKQWDPGGRCSVTKECALDLEILGKLFM
jgi:hypothetical protein